MVQIWDPFDEQHISDPFPIYRRLRDEHPVYHNEERDFFALTRYVDVVAANADWHTFSSAEGVDLDNSGALLFGAGNFVEEDPPLHDQLRAVIRQHLTPKLVSGLEPEIVAKTERLVSELAGRDEVDLASELCLALPLSVVGDMLGLEHDLQDWVYERFLEMFYRESGRVDLPASALTAVREVRGTLADELRKRRAQPREDLLTVIALGEVGGRPLSEDEQLGMSTLIVGAGISTTKNLISNILWYMATDEDIRQSVVGLPPDRVKNAVEEFLRFDSPIQNSSRVTRQEVVLHGVTIPKGARVTLVYGSANRDDRQYTNPDQIQFDRNVGRHIAFGGGIHMCIGAPLARLEARVVLEHGLPKLPRFELVGRPVRSLKMNERGFESLPARLMT